MGSSSSTTASARASSSRPPRRLARPVLAISPHCDDAVFGCGDVLAVHAGAAVVTVFAGSPAPAAALTRWDAAAGFEAGDDVMAARRAEDRAALAALGARALWLPFRDAQYGASPSPTQIADALEAVIDVVEPATVLAPLGLFHGDHRLAHAACLESRRRRPAAAWLLYEDAIYRTLDGLVPERLARLRAAGVTATAGAQGRRASARKRRAVARYRSQLRALAAPGHPGVDDVFAPERLWRLAP
jgi:LmbE family N-acetylglucosaminyl deacetylase